MVKERFFKEINVWQPVDERTVARYRCFEILPDGKFFVQAKNYIYEDSDEEYQENLDDYFFGSLSRENFEKLSEKASPTIEEAIAKHEEDFREMIEEIEKSKKAEL